MKKTGAPRQAALHRATKETDIRVDWVLDGSGHGQIDTSIRFFDHMLELLAKHGFFDLTVQAKGDIDIDEHHTVEDVGITMGKALHQALAAETRLRVKRGAALDVVKHAYSHFGVVVHPFYCEALSIPNVKNLKWVKLGELEDYPMGKVDRQIARQIK